MVKKVINTEDAPKPVGPYSQAIIAENTLYISGQIPLNPSTNKIIDANVSLATKQVMDNIGAILSASDMTFDDVVKCTIFVRDMQQFKEVNAVYFNYFQGSLY